MTRLAALAILATVFGCSVASATGEKLAEPYPPGRWRLASLGDLTRSVLWVSHVLVRHEDVQPGVVSFHLPDWIPSPPPPARTRKEAFELAQRIAAQLEEHPDEFAAVARRMSEDMVTAPLGGSLGGICAAELYGRHSRTLDVLAAIRPGEMSQVVETPYGFHIFLRRPPPPQQTVSGKRIVIAYDEAPWLKSFLARRPIPVRPRPQALALAQSIYDRALEGESFEALVETYSDHEEALKGGDFGEWSNRERTPYPREVEVLQQLAVGEVAPPLDSPFGVQIIKRTPNRPRARETPDVQPETVTTFELPAPDRPDLPYFAGSGSLTDLLPAIATEGARALDLSGADAGQLADLHAAAVTCMDNVESEKERADCLDALLDEIEKGFGAEGQSRYRDFLDGYVTKILLLSGR